MTTTPPEIAGFPAGMPQEYGRRQQVPTGRSKKTISAVKKNVIFYLPHAFCARYYGCVRAL